MIKHYSTTVQKLTPNLLRSDYTNIEFEATWNYYKKLFDSSNVLETLFPRRFHSEEELGDYFNLNSLSELVKIRDRINLVSINAAINTPLWDLIDRGGKRWRPILGLMTAKYFNKNIADIKNNGDLYKITGCIEILHNATLMLDDIIDKSENRRNKACTYRIYGEGIAINAGLGLLYYPVSMVMRTLDNSRRGKFLERYVREMTAINFGQSIDFEMNFNHRIITETNYVDTVLCKTGVFPRLMLGQLYDVALDEEEQRINSTAFKGLNKIFDLLSIAFQIEDDILNITPNELSKGKGFLGEDIYEGKLSLMVIYALANLGKKHSERLREILYMKTKKPDLLAEAIDLIRESGGLTYSQNFSESCVKEATEMCLKLPADTIQSKEAIQEIIQLINYMINRKV